MFEKLNKINRKVWLKTLTLIKTYTRITHWLPPTQPLKKSKTLNVNYVIRNLFFLFGERDYKFLCFINKKNATFLLNIIGLFHTLRRKIKSFSFYKSTLHIKVAQLHYTYQPMGRVTTPQRENPDGSSPVQQTGIPVQQTGVPMSQFAPPSYHQANVNISVGTPWRSGLFDCQEDQTNGIVSILL